jgi:RimJ/RimL family protein N-acetyltransferase
MPPARLETARLILRPWTAADAPALQCAVLDDGRHLAPWMPWATPEAHADVDAIARRLDGFAAEFAAGRDWSYVIESRDDGRLLGAVGLHPRVGPGALEIGYWIRESAEGRGLVTEAVSALADAVLAEGDVDRLEIRCDPRNARSAAVARRLGFRHVTTLVGVGRTPEGTPRDSMVWERMRG